MSLILETGPALEPVSLEEARDYLRIDGTGDDALLGALITAARLHIEAYLGRVLIDQRWRWEGAPPAHGKIAIPLLPVSAVRSVKIVAEASERDLAAEFYETRLVAGQAWIFLKGVSLQDGERVRARFDAGYGASATDVPQTLREAIRQIVAHWFEARGRAGARAMPPSVEALLASYRSVRL